MAERQEPMTEQEYTGPIATMRDSPWLSSEDLEDPKGSGWIQEVVTIEGVMEIHNAQFKGGRSKKKCYAVQFVGKARMLVLNGVNRETLKEMFGRTTPDWIGQRVLLYVKPDVPLGGKRVPGIRIKPAPAHASEPAPLTAEDEAYIAELKGEIAGAESMETLKAIGFILKSKPAAVKDAVRATYAKRQAELEGKQ
jgi:hypothetical protein